MAKKIGVRTVTVVRTPKVDRFSDVSPAETRHDIEGCAILPRASHEEDKGWVIVEGRMVVAPFESDILADDQVEIDGVLWDVDGAPGDYEKKNGRGKATIFYLKRLGS